MMGYGPDPVSTILIPLFLIWLLWELFEGNEE